MKKKALYKEFLMELNRSKSRFISILLIVALGVAFFAGIRATEPDMRISADEYYDTNHLLDIRLLSTLGLTDKDVDYVKSVDGINEVEAVYSFDALLEAGDSDLVVKLYSQTDTINVMNLSEGRMPERSGEVALDSYLLNSLDVTLGDTITLVSGTEDTIEDNIATSIYEIVGIGNSSNYLSHSRGTSTIGNGKVSGFLVLPKEDFKQEAYTEIYATVKGASSLISYEEDYEAIVDKVKDKIEENSSSRMKERYLEVIEEPTKEIEDGEKELEQKELEITKELEDGKEQLATARIELEEGKQKLEDSKKEIEDGKDKLDTAWKEYEDGKQKIEDGKKTIESSKTALQRGKEELLTNKKKVEDGLTSVQSGKEQVLQALSDWQEGYDKVTSGIQTINFSITQLEGKKEQLEPYQSQYEEEYNQVIENLTLLENQKIELTNQNDELITSKVNLDLSMDTLETQEESLASNLLLLQEKEQEVLANETILAEQEKLLITKETQLKIGYETLKTEEVKLEEARTLIETKEIELQDGEKTLIEKEKELEDGQKTAKEEFQKAKDDVAKGKEELGKLEPAKWYILDRNSIQTYVEYGQDAERIANLGKVFPVIFFLVAALVSLTTMTRMVEEQRTQIGTLKSLGYSKLSIASKYILYGLSATLVGSVVGVLVGQKILPQIIINAYKIMYLSLPRAITPYNMYYALLSALISIVCITGTTMVACYKELGLVPASLMRPVAPKEGKRVLFERIPFLWKRLNFTSKSTIRNLLRYKKRFFMTIFGIGGCLALLLVGYGIRDSISAMVDIQYGKLWHKDLSIALSDKSSDEERQEVYDYINNNTLVDNYASFYEFSVELDKEGSSRSVNLMVPEELDTLSTFVTLNNRTSGNKVELTNDGILVSEKVASVLGISVNDSVSLTMKEDKVVTVTVKGIVENYLQHYIFMTSELYQGLMGEEVDYNSIYVTFDNKTSDLSEVNPSDRSDSKTSDLSELLAKELLSLKGVNTITLTDSLKKQVHDMLDSLNVVIYVLILAAGLLAFVVLYNLNNININERKRELATLKVLGFTDMEVAAYVYRENIILTIIGSVIGIFLGILLHRFVILTTEIESMMFGRDILRNSFIYSVLFTFGFSAIVNVVMFYQLRKIDMVESLKSVE